jgi:aminoglycoside phosphotransferase (APT) family kinase protein
MTDTGLAALRATIIDACPELAASAFTLLTAGWDSTAVDVDDRLIFRFPRHEAAERALVREARLLALIRPAVSLPVPELTIHTGPPLFSHHPKLRGEHLLTRDYEDLPDDARWRLAADLARFYAELHDLDRQAMVAAGAGRVAEWGDPEDVLARVLPVLPPGLHAFGEQTIAAWRALPPDPCGIAFGFFDGHGWNMAFDHGRGRLHGVYDFADSGFGPLHQDFIYSNFIAPDLTARIVDAYDALTGRSLDRRRIAVLTGAHRLWELAALADNPEHAPTLIRHVAEWAAVVESS